MNTSEDGDLPPSRHWAQASCKATTQGLGGMLCLRSPSAGPGAIPAPQCAPGKAARRKSPSLESRSQGNSIQQRSILAFLTLTLHSSSSPSGHSLYCSVGRSHPTSPSLFASRLLPTMRQCKHPQNRGGLGKMLPPVPSHLGCCFTTFFSSFCSSGPPQMLPGWKLLGLKRGQRLSSVSLSTTFSMGVQRGWKLLKPDSPSPHSGITPMQ